MKIRIRFLACHNKLPKEFTEITADEGLDITGLKRLAAQRWAEVFKSGLDDENGLMTNLFVTSKGHILQNNEILSDGQEITFVGCIMGG